MNRENFEKTFLIHKDAPEIIRIYTKGIPKRVLLGACYMTRVKYILGYSVWEINIIKNGITPGLQYKLSIEYTPVSVNNEDAKDTGS